MPARSRDEFPLPTQAPRVVVRDNCLWGEVVCVQRSLETGGITRVGVVVGGQLRHLIPSGVVYALKMGVWRLRLPTADSPDAELTVRYGEQGNECLGVAAGPVSGTEDGLWSVPACTHR